MTAVAEQEMSAQTDDSKPEMTIADLKAVRERIAAAVEKMGDGNDHRSLFMVCDWWLVQFANRVVALQTEIARAKAAKAQDDRRIVLPYGAS